MLVTTGGVLVSREAIHERHKPVAALGKPQEPAYAAGRGAHDSGGTRHQRTWPLAPPVLHRQLAWGISW